VCVSPPLLLVFRLSTTFTHFPYTTLFRSEDGWFGWPEDERAEELRANFIAAGTPEEQLRVAQELQAHALDEVLYVPLGQYFMPQDRKSTRLNSSHVKISYAVFCLKKKKK